MLKFEQKSSNIFQVVFPINPKRRFI
jgi:hypothetical protein